MKALGNLASTFYAENDNQVKYSEFLDFINDEQDKISDPVHNVISKVVGMWFEESAENEIPVSQIAEDLLVLWNKKKMRNKRSAEFIPALKEACERINSDGDLMFDDFVMQATNTTHKASYHMWEEMIKDAVDY